MIVSQSQPPVYDRSTKRFKPQQRVPTKYSKKGMKKGTAASTRKLKALVKTVIDSQAEKKMVQFFNNAGLQTSVLASDWKSFNVWTLTSDTGANSTYAIGQGTGQGNRVGNQIRTYKLMVKLAMNINPTYADPGNYNACPIYVTMWVVKLMPHLDDTIDNLQTVVQNSFFQASGTATGFAGNLGDMIKTPNKDQVTVLKKKVYKLGLSEIISSAGNNVANTASNKYMNNDSSMCLTDMIDCTKCLPAVMKFNDGDNITTNRRVYIFFTSARMDGGFTVSSFGVSTGTRPFQVSMGVDYQFTDL